MTVSSIPPATSTAYQRPAQPAGFINALEQLTQALQSGNRSGAQQAHGALSQSLGAKGGQNGPFAQALRQVGDALKSGDLQAARQALASLTQQPRAQAQQSQAGDAKTAATPTGKGSAVDLTA
jgi:DNA-binding GntR family transcriptional regulator